MHIVRGLLPRVEAVGRGGGGGGEWRLTLSKPEAMIRNAAGY